MGGGIRRILCAGLATAIGISGVMTGAPPAAAEPGGIVISELNYHDVSDNDAADFLELANTGPAPIDVSGWTFTAGITATLPAGSIIAPGGYYVVAPDAAVFASNHGFSPNAIYTGKLSNGGETVTLTDTAANTIDSVTYMDADPWPGNPDGLGPSLELRGLLLDNALAENWGPSVPNSGTPRAVNSIDGTGNLPAVKDVVATPQRPMPNQSFVVSAKLPIGSTATLTYKVMFGSNVTIPFRDDAASPGGAGDGQFAATIPGQDAGDLVRYRVNGTSGGFSISAPAADDTINYLGVVVQNPSVSSNLPVIEWFMEPSVYNDMLANHRFDDYLTEAVIAYDGTVYDNVRMRIRGQSSRSKPKVNWKVEMAAGHDMDFRPQMPYLLDEFALQRDPDPLADLAWQTVGESGARRLAIAPVRTQLNGDFWSVGRFMELEDGNWRDAQKVKDWAIYKGDGGRLQRRSSPADLEASLWLDKKTREDEDFTDAWQLSQNIDAPASNAQKAWIEGNVNVPALINYLALSSLMRHTDSGWKNWFIARDTEGTGRWEMWFWDLNWLWATDGEDHDGVFLEPTVDNRFVQAMLAYPDYKTMFYRRLRTLADQYLGAGQYEAKWDAIVGPYVNDWALDDAKWGDDIRSSSFARQKFIQGLTDRRSVIANNTGSGRPVPAAQSAAPNIVINEIMYQPAGPLNTEFIELTNPTSESVDLSGWTIDGIDLTIQGGTVLLPGASIVFVANDAEFRQAYGSTRFVGGEYSGKLKNEGETITLYQGVRVVDQVAYSPTAPWPTAAAGGGPSLELGAPNLDNSIPTNWWATSSSGGSPGQTNVIEIPPDTTPPGAPGTLSSSGPLPAGITLTWGPAGDDRGVTGYQVLRDGAVIATTSGLTYTDSAVTGPNTYDYSVKAFDAEGNVGAPSNVVTETTPPGYAPSLFSDSFAGANGAGWGPSWTTTSANGSATIQSGAGRLAFNNTSGAYARAQLTGLAARGDTDTLMSYQWSGAGSRAYFNVYARGSGGWANTDRPRTGYGVELRSDSGTVTLRRVVNGAVTTLQSVSGAQVTGTQKQWLRLRVVGSTIQFKIWSDGTTEPSAWRATVTDTSVTTPGQLFITNRRSGSNSGNRHVDVDDVLVTTNGGATPPADTEAPSVPAGLDAPSVGSNSVTLSWTASTDNTGVTGYEVLRNGTAVGTVATTGYVDNGLAPSTLYTYTVRARDAAGNFSAASAGLPVTTLAGGGGSLFSDLFAGVNGAGWGPSWTTTSANGSATIQSDAGRLAFNNTSGAYARAQLSGLAAQGDTDTLMSYQWNAGGARAYLNVYTRGSGGWLNSYRPRNGYGLELRSDSGDVQIKRVANGTTTTLQSVTGAQVTGSQKQWLRLRVVGSTIQFKIWTDGATEPAAWTSTVTDSSVTASGQLFISNVRSGSNTGNRHVDIDDVEVTAGS